MPVKLQKKQITSDPSKIISHLHNLRTKVILPRNDDIHQKLIQLVRSLQYEYMTPEPDDLNSAEMINRGKITIGKQLVMEIPIIDSSILDERYPEEIRNIICFFKTNLELSFNNIRKVDVKIYPPAQKVSTYRTKIPRMAVTCACRVIIFLCSDELINYKIMNMKGSSELFGIGLPSSCELPEAVERGNAYCFNSLSGISFFVVFNDEETYVIRKRERTEARRKLPRSRYVVVIDYEYTAEATREQLKENVRMLKNSIDSESKEKQSMAKKVVAAMERQDREDLKKYAQEDIKMSAEEFEQFEQEEQRKTQLQLQIEEENKEREENERMFKNTEDLF